MSCADGNVKIAIDVRTVSFAYKAGTEGGGGGTIDGAIGVIGNSVSAGGPSVGNRENAVGSNVLKKVSVTVPQGQIYALLGSSGCGKTTLLRCILGRLKPQSGTVKIFGRTPGTAHCPVPGSGVGYMPQETALFSEFTIMETLRYFGQIYEMRADEIRRRSEHLIELLDLPKSKSRHVTQLSGGQQRRVSLAAALIHGPPVLILDEPTVGLDPVLRIRIWQYLHSICSANGLTVIITTHYIEEARHANTVGLMRYGRLLAQSNPETLLARHRSTTLEEVFFKLCHLDTGVTTEYNDNNHHNFHNSHHPNHPNYPHHHQQQQHVTTITSDTFAMVQAQEDLYYDDDNNNDDDKASDNNSNSNNNVAGSGCSSSSFVANTESSKLSTSDRTETDSQTSSCSDECASSSSSSIDNDEIKKKKKPKMMSSSSPSPSPSPSPSSSSSSSSTDDQLYERTYVNFQRIKALFIKNMIRLTRSYFIFIVFVLLPSIQMAIFCFAVKGVPRDLPVAVYSPENPPELSAKYLSFLAETRRVRQIRFETFESAKALVIKGKAWAAVQIPFNYTRAINKRHNLLQKADNATISASNIKLHVDMTNQILGWSVVRTFFTAFKPFAVYLLESLGYNTAVLTTPITVNEPIYGTMKPDIIGFLFPGLLVLISYYSCTALTALSLVLERKDGLLERTLAAGVTAFEFMISHVASNLVMITLQQTFLLFTSFYLFQFPSQGSIELVVGLAFSQGAAGVMFGLLVSSMCESEVTAAMIGGSFFFPSILIGGLFWPIESMPAWGYYASNLVPQTMAAEAMRTILFRGWAFSNVAVWSGFAVSWAWAVLFFTAAAYIFNKFA